MSGIFVDGKWYENADMKCRKCGSPVYESDNPEYVYQCFACDEDLYSFETEEQDPHYFPRVMVARPVDGITINEQLEYLLNPDTKEPEIFASQADAEAWLTALGYHMEELEHFYFVECVDEAENSSDK